MEENPYKCKQPGCDKSYTTKQGLKYHVKRMHQEKASEQVFSAVDEIQEKAIQLKAGPTRVALSCEIFTDLLTDVLYDLCFDIHRRAKLEPMSFSYAKTEEKPGVDIYGNIPDVNTVQLDCPRCERITGAPKFAAHLEKCMGLSRSRTAKKLIAEKSEKDRETQRLFGDFEDDDESDATYTNEKKRKKTQSKPKGKKKKARDYLSDSPTEGGSPSSPLSGGGYGNTGNNSNTETPVNNVGTPVSNPGNGNPVPKKTNPGQYMKQVNKHAKNLLKEMSIDQIKQQTDKYCAAISTSSGKLCQKAKCSIHTDEQREISRKILFSEGSV